VGRHEFQAIDIRPAEHGLTIDERAGEHP
jgi:hypothetical protein